ncbi:MULTISPECIES: BglG family transcription antiterminator [unclassified Clostridioides]|uniref:BglG family transcription antiterminator n=1 Tax=unclassified Clostridioides TaxID=2635829 RepID=UPI001D0C24DD|nr:transcription antiterminator [Clostridioides sp. ES-S-0049-03]MCC0653881.1 transcription antiterminator [Clostridioides sp. ES-S-0001-03]MCC0677541.1 transcription antiterminator [Clostridioides sp. ES-W-0018-02]MCC0712219.1 transcription antiterminator [Clostridioides sp. ES-W-0017-02]
MDKEIVSILQVLLNSTLITADELQEESNASKRQITYRINKINDILKVKKVPLIYLRADKDIIVKKDTKDAIREILEKNYSKNTYYFSKTERLLYMYLMLFINLEDISINHFIDSIKVSRSTVNLDFKDLIPELEKKNIKVKNNRINGYYLVGNEMEIRRVLIKNIIETLSNEKSSRVFDIFIEEYKLDSFEEAKKIILKLVKKYEITFVEDRLIEFIYIFIFLKARMYSNRIVIQENIDIPNIAVMSSMKEYKFARELLEVYESKEKIKSHNIMYISAWILGISVGNDEEDTEDRAVISKIVNKMMTKFGYLSGVYYISQEKIFKRLYSHFRPAYYRLLFKLPIYNPICEKVKEEYRLVYRIVSNAMKEFCGLFGEDIQEEELAYLTMHFATLFSDKKEFDGPRKRRALIVCSNGVGSSAILHAELTSLFPDLHFLPILESSELGNISESVDIVFTTNYKAEGLKTDVPVIKVSPVMTPKEKYKVTREVYIQLGDIFLRQPKIDEVMDIIKKYAKVTSESMLSSELLAYFTQIENFTSKEGEGPMLSDITNETLIKLRIKAKDWEEAIRQSASVLVENNKVTEAYVDAMVNSAKASGPYIVITKHVALPHARPEAGAKEIAIGIATLENPVEFGNDNNDPVKYVFCLSAIDNNSHLRAMSELVELLEEEEFFRVLDNAKEANEIIDFIKTHEL